MSVNYSHEAATASFYSFPKLLLKWKGSARKLVAIEAVAWSIAYFIIHAVYLLALRVIIFFAHKNALFKYATICRAHQAAHNSKFIANGPHGCRCHGAIKFEPLPRKV